MVSPLAGVSCNTMGFVFVNLAGMFSLQPQSSSIFADIGILCIFVLVITVMYLLILPALSPGL